MSSSVASRWVSFRWAAIAVIALSSSLNFLDRQVLAALAPQLMREFRITAAEYGDVIFAFSICYALAAPLAGLFIDRLGLRLGTSLAVAGWSLAGLTTGLTSTLGQLTICRSVLGIAEAGGIPGTGKACAIYLKPQERAIGSGITQMGLSFGAIAAPLLAETCSRLWGWRSAFMVAGAIGFAWIPLWMWVSGRAGRTKPEENAAPAGRPGGRPRTGGSAPPLAPKPARAVTAGAILGDPRYWAILAANVLSMLAYSLWVNWTTVFLVRVHHMPQHLANTQLAWIPPVFASAGGLFGGWLAMRWFDGKNVLRARMRAILTSSVLLLATALVPLAPTAGVATALICLSFFACVLGSVNIYSLPLDIFGSSRAAFAVSGLTSVYGLVQGAFSSVAGRVVEAQGFAPLCVAVALCPLGAWLVLRAALRVSLRQDTQDDMQDTYTGGAAELNPPEITTRRMEQRDLAEIDRIQAASPDASHWKPEEYLGYESIVAEYKGRVAGFAVARMLPRDEVEILNIATDPGVRRRGAGSALMQALLNLPGNVWFLEVRESNAAARALYKAAGFDEVGRRRDYYPGLGLPGSVREDAVVMKMQK